MIDDKIPTGATRRGLFGAVLGLAAAGVPARAAAPAAQMESAGLPGVLPFYGPHQNGIATPMQPYTYFAALDVTTTKLDELVALMRRWTDAAARLTQGQPVLAGSDSQDAPPLDSGDVLGLSASRLTITFGFGPGLFSKDGADRFGLAADRPEAFVDLPKFVGDQLVPERSGGDLSIQACADDQQVAMHAVRQLMRLAYGVAVPRWVQAGFTSGPKDKTPRNLMGFKDGTANISASDGAAMDQVVWVGDEGGAWMHGGSYAVVRPIRIALEHWDRMKLAFQEQTIGRHKISGAPIGATDEFAPTDLAANDEDGNPVIAENAHVRLASPVTNAGAQILRRGYSYDNGVSMVAERWPPWRHLMEMDAGLLFICYQRDPRAGFIRIFERMAKFDMLNQFVTTVGGGLFACPGGVAEGRYLGQDLFERV